MSKSIMEIIIIILSYASGQSVWGNISFNYSQTLGVAGRWQMCSLEPHPHILHVEKMEIIDYRAGDEAII